MHSLTTIIRRNAAAAGREAAHAANDEDLVTLVAIDRAERALTRSNSPTDWAAYYSGFYSGLQEG